MDNQLVCNIDNEMVACKFAKFFQKNKKPSRLLDTIISSNNDLLSSTIDTSMLFNFYEINFFLI